MWKQICIDIVKDFDRILIDQLVDCRFQIGIIFDQSKSPVGQIIDIHRHLENNALYTADHFRNDQTKKFIKYYQNQYDGQQDGHCTHTTFALGRHGYVRFEVQRFDNAFFNFI